MPDIPINLDMAKRFYDLRVRKGAKLIEIAAAPKGYLERIGMAQGVMVIKTDRAWMVMLEGWR